MSATSSIEKLGFDDVESLRLCYMDWVVNGGLFVSSKSARARWLGDPVFLVIRLPDSSRQHAINGRVVWLSCGGARPPGFGVQFPSDASGTELRETIETTLAGLMGGDRATHTL